MKINDRNPKTKPKFEDERTGFNAAIAVAALKGRLLEEWIKPNSAVYSRDYLDRAGDEAASLAWSTGFPLLIFPILFEEKARNARIQAFRQNEIKAKSKAWTAALHRTNPSRA